MRKLAALLFLFWLTPDTVIADTVMSDSMQCIQNPKRIKACPHILYRSAQLPQMQQAQLICICVTDFADLLKTPATDRERIEQRMTLRQREAEMSMELEPVLQILRRQR